MQNFQLIYKIKIGFGMPLKFIIDDQFMWIIASDSLGISVWDKVDFQFKLYYVKMNFNQFWLQNGYI